MLTKIEARNVQGSLLTLLLGDASNGYILADVDGLGPVKAVIAQSSFATVDGTQFQGARREARNIKLQIELQSDYVTNTVRQLRTNLYNFFMPKSIVSLRLYLEDGLTVDISGRVEDCSPAIFTKEPAVDISILCFDVDFIGLAPVEVSGTSVSTTVETPHVYSGSTEVGFEFTLHVDRTLTAFTIYHRRPDNVLQSLDIAANLIAGDLVKISTITGAKSVSLIRAGVTSSLLNGMSPQSSWLELLPGTNYFRVYALGAGLLYGFVYTPRYGGL